ncbi:MAG: hypothetical protein B7Z73_04420 [Planctomycetia bacterium 21-64-5]|nr:MAG: hypothetical protein B7Z73_04420 [Planctomycetia bacterium 21-64-5]HQU43444.1 hypothetical protein [Pirellulales bacterium]
MRDQLLGYLLGALEPAEQDEVEARLFTDVELQRDLAELRRKLVLLDDGDEFEPPGGLAARTCNYVAARAPAAKNAALPAPLGGWRVQDMIVGGGIFLAACLLLFPAIANSLSHARLTACQNNLRAIGVAMGQYSDFNGGFFPLVPEQGPLAVAGSYGPTLVELKLIEGPNVLVCPAARQAEDVGPFTVPTMVQVMNAPAADLPRLQAQMGGSYGYTFGYIEHGHYRGHRNHGRPNFALMADAPGEASGGRSANHGGAGQNVLFEDLHVVFLKHCQLSGCGDHIYINGHGYVGAGIGPDDAVIGRSSARPVTFQLVPR